MKTDWKLGDRFCYCINKGNIERGYFSPDVVPLYSKYEVIEYVGGDFVISNGWVFYFDEIKPIIKVKGQLA